MVLSEDAGSLNNPPAVLSRGVRAAEAFLTKVDRCRRSSIKLIELAGQGAEFGRTCYDAATVVCYSMRVRHRSAPFGKVFTRNSRAVDAIVALLQPIDC